MSEHDSKMLSLVQRFGRRLNECGVVNHRLIEELWVTAVLSLCGSQQGARYQGYVFSITQGPLPHAVLLHSFNIPARGTNTVLIIPIYPPPYPQEGT